MKNHYPVQGIRCVPSCRFLDDCQLFRQVDGCRECGFLRGDDLDRDYERLAEQQELIHISPQNN